MGKDNIYISLTESISFQRLNESNLTESTVNGTLTGQNDLFVFDSELTIQEQVVIGAVATVAFLSLLAIVLRLLMPMFRRDRHKVIQTECKYTEQVISKEKRYGQLPYKASSSSNSSQSSSWSSNSQLDWSDSSSNKTRSTYYTTESKNLSLPSSYGNFRGSTASLPVSLSDDRSSRSNAASYLRYINEDPVYILNKKSLEPLKLDDAYRQRWDEEFDPLQVTPSGSLSSLSHPSENRRIQDKSSDFYNHKGIPQKVHNLANVRTSNRQIPNQDYKGSGSIPTQSCRM